MFHEFACHFPWCLYYNTRNQVAIEFISIINATKHSKKSGTRTFSKVLERAVVYRGSSMNSSAFRCDKLSAPRYDIKHDVSGAQVMLGVIAASLVRVTRKNN